MVKVEDVFRQTVAAREAYRKDLIQNTLLLRANNLVIALGFVLGFGVALFAAFMAYHDGPLRWGWVVLAVLSFVLGCQHMYHVNERVYASWNLDNCDSWDSFLEEAFRVHEDLWVLRAGRETTAEVFYTHAVAAWAKFQQLAAVHKCKGEWVSPYREFDWLLVDQYREVLERDSAYLASIEMSLKSVLKFAEEAQLESEKAKWVSVRR